MSNQTLYTFKANLKDLVKLQQDLDKATAKLKTLKKTDKETTSELIIDLQEKGFF